MCDLKVCKFLLGNWTDSCYVAWVVPYVCIHDDMPQEKNRNLRGLADMAASNPAPETREEMLKRLRVA